MINKNELLENNIDIIDNSNNLKQEKEDKIEKIKEILPDAINSDNILNIEVLKDLLNITKTTANNQGYELKFAGKGFAKAKADQPTTKELKAELKQSKNFDTTENVIIRGDNLDVLKILKQNYYRKIKMIYIDPPYNTGKDKFLYSDDFKTTEKELIEELGLEEDTINYLQNIYGTNKHSAWLSFMYPRLKLAKELLTKDGVIFISIDDNEQANLKLLCDEIFGEENFVTQLTIETGAVFGEKSSHVNKTFVKVKDYVLVYEMKSNDNKIPLMDRSNEFYDSHFNTIIKDNTKETFINFLKNDKKSKYYFDKYSMEVNNSNIEKLFNIDNNFKDYIYNDVSKYLYQDAPYSSKLTDKEKEKLNNNFFIKINNNLIFRTSTGSIRRYVPFSNSIKITDDYCPQKTRAFFRGDLWKNFNEDNKNIQDEGGVEFNNGKKPVRLIKNLAKWMNDKNMIILDFFAGSGTTAHAVMELNKEDGGNRKFILAQLDEVVKNEKDSIDSYNFIINNKLTDKRSGEEPYISDITIERVNRSGENIKNELNSNNEERLIDIGYKVFSLTEKPKLEHENNQFELFNKREKTIDILYNMMSANNVELSTKIEEVEKDKLYLIDNCYYMVAKCNQDLIDKKKQVYVDGYCNDVVLTFMLNLKETFNNDNVKVVY